MKKNVSTTLMTATLATVIGLGGAAIVNPTVVQAEETQQTWKDLVHAQLLDEVDNGQTAHARNLGRLEIKYVLGAIVGNNPGLADIAQQVPEKYITLERENLSEDEKALEKLMEDNLGQESIIKGYWDKYHELPNLSSRKYYDYAESLTHLWAPPKKKDVDTSEDGNKKDVPKPDVEVVAPEKDADIDVKDEAVGTEDKTDVDQPEAEVVAPEKDAETPAEDNAPAEVETPKVDDAEKPAVVPGVDTEVKIEEKEETSNKSSVKDQTVGSDTEAKAAEGKQKQEPKHMKKSATPNTADVTAAYLLSGLGFGLLSRKKH